MSAGKFVPQNWARLVTPFESLNWVGLLVYVSTNFGVGFDATRTAGGRRCASDGDSIASLIKVRIMLLISILLPFIS